MVLHRLILVVLGLSLIAQGVLSLVQPGLIWKLLVTPALSAPFLTGPNAVFFRTSLSSLFIPIGLALTQIQASRSASRAVGLAGVLETGYLLYLQFGRSRTLYTNEGVALITAQGVACLLLMVIPTAHHKPTATKTKGQ